MRELLYKSAKPLLILLFLFCSLEVVNAQSYTWEKIYNVAIGDDHAYCNTEIYNNNYYYVGGMRGSGYYILKINPVTGDTLWTRKASLSPAAGYVSAIVLTDDGSCILSGRGFNSFIAKFDSSGNLIWNKFYNAGNIKKIIKLSDGDYLMCGGNFVLKINSDGDSIWAKSNTLYCDYSSVAELNEKYYLVGTYGYHQVILTSLNTRGDILSNNIYAFLNSECYAGNITVLSNNLFLTGDLPNGYFIAKLNLNGDVIFENRISSPAVGFYANSKYYNGHFYFSASLNGIYDSVYCTLLVSDTLGNNADYKLFRKYLEYDLHDFIILNKHSFILTGATLNTDNIYLARVDSLFMNSTGINSSSEILPDNFSLSQNYPNPFNPSTKISYSLKKSSSIELKLFDINGRMIKIIESGFKPAGSYEINFNSEGLSSGVYFYSLYSEGIFMDTKRMVVLK